MQAAGAPTLPSESRTVPALVASAAAHYADACAVEDGDVRLGFRVLAAEGLRAARAFATAGVRKGDRVGVWAPNLVEWIVAAIGLQSAGGVLVPLNTRYKGAEAAYILRKSGARLLLTMGDFLGTNYVEALSGEELPGLERIVTFRGQGAGATSWADFLVGADDFPEDEARARAESVAHDDLSDLLYTSGTTGNPKGVMMTHGQTLRVFASWSEIFGLREGDRYLVVNPFFHTFGYKAGWLSSIMRGATVLPHQVFDAESVMERVSREQVSVLPGPPTIYQSMLAHPERDRFDLSSLRLAVTGAAAIPVELVRRMGDELGFERVLTAYGLTEVCGTATMCRPGDDPETIATTSPASPRATSLPSASTQRTSTSGMARPEVVAMVSGSSPGRHMVAVPHTSVSP